jgi:hypothetical protein
MAHNLLSIMIDACEFRITVGEAELAQNQIPPLALVTLRPAVPESHLFILRQPDPQESTKKVFVLSW